MNLTGKKLVLGISGGIAAYKCAELSRRWVQAGAEVQVVMTAAAQKFITPLTMETVTGKQVHCDLFPADQYSATVHIDLADWAQAVVIAPATADIISKIRLGQGDDLLTTICLAAWKKTILAPSMNVNMWSNPVVQENIKALEKHGYLVIHPATGDLACGYSGVGRLADLEVINHWLQYYLQPRTVLENKTVLITAGRTEEEIDPVRIITNRSSGKMGFALAEQAFYHGARVILIAGPNNLRPIPGVEYHQVVSAEEMHQAVMKLVDRADVVIANAAVSDYRSKNVLFRKLKKEKKEIKLELVANPDILAEIGKRKGKRLLVGFAIETHNEKENALEKMHKKNLDMIILNNPSEEGAGFATNTNKVIILKRRAKPLELPVMSKTDVAARIMEEIIKVL
jgi:phosphopantothenoylcysteine decarboxylase / phosphopantothenate---cysteine ligase